MAATIGMMQSAVVSVPSSSLVTRPAQSLRGGIVSLPVTRRAFTFRCQASENSPSGLRDSVDKVTKKEITKEEILRNQETNQSEKQSVFGAVPSSGSFYPRPEVERRPETGDRSFGSIFDFDGAAPETINGRLAMLGFAWAILAEKASGLTVMEQLFAPGAVGLPFFIVAVQIFAYASVVPILNGESTDARSWGPFTARAERWNGRLAMIGFAALLIVEAFRHSAVFGM
jgi:hypothetical protein